MCLQFMERKEKTNNYIVDSIQKRKVLSPDIKVLKEFALLISSGKLFHNFRAAAVNATILDKTS